MRTGPPLTSALASDGRVSGGTMRGDKMNHLEKFYHDDCGIAGWIVAAVIGFLVLFGFSAAAAIEWKFILALMAIGVIGIAFIGVVFFHADFSLVIAAALISLAIVFIVEISFPVVIGGLVVGAAMWNLKILRGKPLILFLLIVVGLGLMVWGSYYILLPMGIFP